MFDDLMDEDAQTPQARQHRARLAMLLAGGALVVGVILWFAWQGFTAHTPASQSSVGTASSTAATATTAAGPKTGQGDPPIYWQTIEQQMAEGLHLTVAQVKARLQPPPGQRDGPSIAVIATQLGIPEAQWRAIEINAIQKGHDLLVSMGYLTQQGSDQGMQTIRNWDQATLDDHVTRWFLNN
jgi:hypothetical protein